MSRRNRSTKRIAQPDAIYNSVKLSMFVNILLKKGKKSVAENIMYSTLDLIKEKAKQDPIKYLETTLENVRPVMEVKSRRVGGSNYQIPVEVRPERALTLAIRWLVSFAQARKGNSMTEKLTAEIMDAYNKTGGAIKKREDMHKMAESNKAFAHFRW